MSVKIGTRGSDLALYQARSATSALERAGVSAQIQIINTRGDKDYRPFTQISGDGFFTKELEHALHSDQVQLAIHSGKDLPSMIHSGLPWMAFGDREETADILIAKKSSVVSRQPLKLKPHALVGTSSPRRLAQLQKTLSDIRIEPLRGNVPTRIEKVATGPYDATVLAKAGVKRLGLLAGLEARGLICVELDWVTAPCQGIMAAQANDFGKDSLLKIANAELDTIAKLEKHVLAFLGGGCHLALGAQAKRQPTGFELSIFHYENEVSFDFKTESARASDGFREFVSCFSGAKGGPRIWLTQPLQHALRPARIASASGTTPVVWPLTSIAPTWTSAAIQDFIKNAEQYEAVAFSSQFGAQLFITEASPYMDIIDWLSRRVIWAVGDSTAARLKEHGVMDVRTPPEAHSKSLAPLIVKELKGRLLLPGQNHSSLRAALGEYAARADLLELYQAKPSNDVLTLEIPHVQMGDSVVLTSAFAAKEFVLWCERRPELKKLSVWAFGPTTSKALLDSSVNHRTNPVSGSWESLIETIIAKA